MVIGEKVLSHYTQLRSFRNSPGYLRVKPRVGRDRLRGKSTGMVDVQIPIHSGRQFKTGAKLRLVDRIGTSESRTVRCPPDAGRSGPRFRSGNGEGRRS